MNKSRNWSAPPCGAQNRAGAPCRRKIWATMVSARRTSEPRQTILRLPNRLLAPDLPLLAITLVGHGIIVVEIVSSPVGNDLGIGQPCRHPGSRKRHSWPGVAKEYDQLTA